MMPITKILDAGFHKFDLGSDISGGVYILKISGMNQSLSQKVIIE